ncbi:MAG: hypothetical protein ABI778_07155 [Ignavibacteriota bacterium]
MWTRRLALNAIFFVGTILAAFGWLGELRDWPELAAVFLRFGSFAIAGHVLQIVGAFGIMVMPDEVRDEKDFES